LSISFDVSEVSGFQKCGMKIVIIFRHVCLPVRSLESLTVFLYHSVLGIFANIYRHIAT